MVRVHKKVERRERKREARAEKVALIDNKIKAELLERLKQGTYGDIYNFRQEAFEEVLDEEEALQEEEEIEPEFVADEYLDEDIEDIDSIGLGYDLGFGESDFNTTEESEKSSKSEHSKKPEKAQKPKKAQKPEKPRKLEKKPNDSSEEPKGGSDTKKRKRASLAKPPPTKKPKRYLEIEYDTPDKVKEKHT